MTVYIALIGWLILCTGVNIGMAVYTLLKKGSPELIACLVGLGVTSALISIVLAIRLA